MQHATALHRPPLPPQPLLPPNTPSLAARHPVTRPPCSRPRSHALCTCIYGSSIAAQQQQGQGQQQQGQPPANGGVAAEAAAAAQERMLRACATWRLLQGPDGRQEPVAIMLPKLVRQVPVPGSVEAVAAAAAAAAARLEQAEAAAQAAVLRAASLAAACGLPYRPPEGLNISLAGIPVVSCRVEQGAGV